MSDATFYVKDVNGKLVAATFFQYDGKPYADINASHARSIPLYDAKGILLKTQNVNGYLIVPADLNLGSSLSFARSVSSTMASYTEDTNGEEINNVPFALGMMAGAFYDGPQDSQRTYDGFSGQPPVIAFRDAASFNLGLISAYSGTPISWAEEGGGALNILRSASLLLRGKPALDVSGVDGNSKLNENSIEAGYKFSSILRGSANYVPLHAAALAIGKSRKSVSVAPTVAAKKKVVRRLKMGLPAGSVLPVPVSPARSGAVKGAAGKSSLNLMRPVFDVAFAEIRARALAAQTPLRSRYVVPAAVGEAVSARRRLEGGWAAPVHGRQVQAPVAVARRGVGAAAALVGARAGAGGAVALAGRRSGLVEVEDSAGAGSESAAGALAVARMARRREALGRVAPVGKGRMDARPDKVAVRRGVAAAEASAPVAGRTRNVDVEGEERRFGRMLSEFLDRQARLPPSGATGFDPRLSPAWPGLKLPG